MFLSIIVKYLFQWRLLREFLHAILPARTREICIHRYFLRTSFPHFWNYIFEHTFSQHQSLPLGDTFRNMTQDDKRWRCLSS